MTTELVRARGVLGGAGSQKGTRHATRRTHECAHDHDTQSGPVFSGTSRPLFD